ncbi:MAG: CHAT domain-containing tetratricopeptide repeat protein [Thermodesulfobacteriota bacterium]
MSGAKSRRERGEYYEEKEPTRRAQKLPEAKKRKLAKPRVPYLQELAVDIDDNLREMVRTGHSAAVKKLSGELQLAKKTGDPRKEREASVRLGHAYYLTGQVNRAAQNYSRSLEIDRKAGDVAKEVFDLLHLAAAFTAAGKFQQAENSNGEALQLLRTAGTSRDAQMALNNLGVLEKNRARYDRSLERYEAALAIRQEPDKVRVLILRNLGNFYRLWGEYAKAIQDFDKAADLSGQLADYAEAGEIELESGQVYAQEGRTEQALERMNRSLDLFAKANAPTDWVKKLMGDILLDAGRLAEAEPYIKEADYDSSLGRFYLLKAQPQEARKAYEQLLSAAQNEENLDELFVAYTGLGKVFEAMKNYNRAQQYYSKAVEIAEEIRSSLLLSERKNFFSVKVSGFLRSDPAKGLVKTSLKLQKPDRSIYPSESTKAREFADNISQKADRRHFSVPPELILQENELTNKLAAIKTALAVIPKSSDNRRWAEMKNEIRSAENEAKTFLKSLCEQYRDYCAVIHPSPVTLDKADIGPDEHVLMFDVLNDGIAIRLLKGRKIVKASFLECSSQDLENDVRNFRGPFERVQFTKFSSELAASLHERLAAHVLESVPEGSPVTIIPDGVLALLPFEALVTGGAAEWYTGRQGDFPRGLTYLGDRNPVVYSQSLTAMTLARQIAKTEEIGPAVLVMTDPVFSPSDERVRDVQIPKTQAGELNCSRAKSAVERALAGPVSLRRLKETGELGNRLKEQYGESCEVLSGLHCSKRAFMMRVSGNSSSFRHLIFGTHGFTANDFPGVMEPFLALTMVPDGIDGFLTMTDVAGLKINADVATLMACKTGVGTKLEGEGVMSMGRSFQCAGARSVIMSLWSVAEKPSVMLLEEFFKGRQQGLGKLQAWVRSKAVLREKGFEHPFFWASFILVGEKD